MELRARNDRLLILAGSSLLCAGLAGLVALYAHGKSLPPSDAAFGMSVWDSLLDPLVLGVWVVLTALGAAVGFPLAVWALWHADLTRAIPIVTLATVLTAGASALVYAPMSPMISLGAALATMVWFRVRAKRVDDLRDQGDWTL